MKAPQLLLLASLGLLVGCKAQGAPRFEANLAASSQYVFRGVPRVDKPVLQPDTNTTVETEDGELQLGYWANIELRSTTGNATFPDGNAREVSEVDLSGSYSGHLSGTAYSIGFINYDYPNFVGPSTLELFLRLAWDWGDQLVPSVTGYYDVDDVNGFYGRVAIDRGIELGEETTASLGLGCGISDRDHSIMYYGVSESGLADASANASLTTALGEHTTLTFFVVASKIVDKDLEDSLDRQTLDPENLWGGVSLGWSY